MADEDEEEEALNEFIEARRIQPPGHRAEGNDRYQWLRGVLQERRGEDQRDFATRAQPLFSQPQFDH